MPAKKKNTYEVEGKRFKAYENAVAFAADLSLQREESVTVLEHGQTGNYYINITATSEPAD